VGDAGQLFGSVTANEIADALEEKGIKVDKRRIELAHAIKSIGTHDVDVRLHREVTAHVQVEVLPIGVEKLEDIPAPAAPKAPKAAKAAPVEETEGEEAPAEQ
jgi:large subunit ribosomal protein L9